jgi:DNA invertase Pin-like site-specific DNA recombinase
MAGRRIGYIRVSSLDQRVQRQLDGIELEGLHRQWPGQRRMWS